MTSFCQRILFVFLCVFIGVATPQCVIGPPGIEPTELPNQTGGLDVIANTEPKTQKSESDNYTSLITIISVIGGFLFVTDVVLVLLFLHLRKAMILLQSNTDQRYEVLLRPCPSAEQGLYLRIQSPTLENDGHHSYMEVIDGHI